MFQLRSLKLKDDYSDTFFTEKCWYSPKNRYVYIQFNLVQLVKSVSFYTLDYMLNTILFRSY